jgi:DNA mismatch endonuclease (patch repair protein)
MSKVRKMYIRDERTPIPGNEKVSWTMSRIRAKNTKPELVVREKLSQIGVMGYRLHLKKVPGKPDIIFSKKKIVIFIHGCFWHKCPRCKLPLLKANRRFWSKKFDRNRKRDIKKARLLRRNGWKVLTIWEHQIKRGPDKAVEKIIDLLEGVRV